MSIYREIRVRPVVRYVITEFLDDESRRGSSQIGEFNSASVANAIGDALAYRSRMLEKSHVTFEPTRPLRIDAIRGEGKPRPSVEYRLREVNEDA